VTKDDTEIVSALQVALANKVGAERFDLWFGSNARLSLSSGALRVGVPNQFLQDWLRNNFRRDIEAACCEALGHAVPVSFHVDPLLAAGATPRRSARERNAARDEAAASTSGTIRLHHSSATTAAAQEPASERTGFRRRFASLETFVVGAGNRLAHLAAQGVVARLGSTSPLLIHGPSGAGKTHLLEGIWIAAKKAQPALQRSTSRPSSSPAISSKRCTAAACPTSAASIAAWDC
jgi:chromosomal replication initiator protein